MNAPTFCESTSASSSARSRSSSCPSAGAGAGSVGAQPGAAAAAAPTSVSGEAASVIASSSDTCDAVSGTKMAGAGGDAVSCTMTKSGSGRAGAATAVGAAGLVQTGFLIRDAAAALPPNMPRARLAPCTSSFSCGRGRRGGVTSREAGTNAGGKSTGKAIGKATGRNAGRESTIRQYSSTLCISSTHASRGTTDKAPAPLFPQSHESRRCCRRAHVVAMRFHTASSHSSVRWTTAPEDGSTMCRSHAGHRHTNISAKHCSR